MSKLRDKLITTIEGCYPPNKLDGGSFGGKNKQIGLQLLDEVSWGFNPKNWKDLPYPDLLQLAFLNAEKKMGAKGTDALKKMIQEYSDTIQISTSIVKTSYEDKYDVVLKWHVDNDPNEIEKSFIVGTFPKLYIAQWYRRNIEDAESALHKMKNYNWLESNSKDINR